MLHEYINSCINFLKSKRKIYLIVFINAIEVLCIFFFNSTDLLT